MSGVVTWQEWETRDTIAAGHDYEDPRGHHAPMGDHGRGRWIDHSAEVSCRDEAVDIAREADRRTTRRWRFTEDPRPPPPRRPTRTAHPLTLLKGAPTR